MRCVLCNTAIRYVLVNGYFLEDDDEPDAYTWRRIDDLRVLLRSMI